MPSEIVPNAGLYLYLPLAVLICSIVQSLVGVGLLLFGTPTLLLLGMEFGETLAVLLPCSVTVNLCQLHGGLPCNKQAILRIARITLPMIFLGLLTTLWGMDTRWMPIVVGFALLGLGVLRLSSRALAWLNRVVASYQNTYLAVMGLAHGLSNMGGGLLVVYAGTLSDDKEEIRRTIALGYLAFALTQLATLAINQPQLFHTGNLCLPVISLLSYLAGNRLFQHLSTAHFGRLVTGLVLTYGVVTVGKALG
ncbi:Sulfite exporter TauE/SafE [Variovorax sp. PBL-H6]|uniref:hypothetical protein n=1 Tax=Variovorax sp. PBL-H6 TaxID=434009 RepID=UPI001318AEF2|nr:hypothetical protein [Variovorax sp. PBL-H6]VTU34570.1 Sulfite exporter TauE/SafE [Variovorax sp. PBL-H6]